MTVAELIQELLKVDDITKQVYTFNDQELRPVTMVDELSDRVDINLGEQL
jgi:hypothetical protein